MADAGMGDEREDCPCPSCNCEEKCETCEGGDESHSPCDDDDKKPDNGTGTGGGNGGGGSDDIVNPNPDDAKPAPEPCNGCAETYYCNSTGCNGGSPEWYASDECIWSCNGAGCYGFLAGTPGESWSFFLGKFWPTMGTCYYWKDGGDCPSGNYTLDYDNNCGDCITTETLYS